ncbi:CobW family GTP-binding protein [Desulfotomaculum copahuensis]|uniref:Uncharacterized protein n=1 Tax=Desulfotomaculum copahuensis TaxID=1838280 RepID=A0A1B7LIA2_9FIRM|nr:GTP-binding protein [Desulfotomaculum copahuensis]OAT86143.1 hypothetical protein A6M21_04315 [Desulfotomaculum copahuensis]
MSDTTDVFLITGFLGSGKTTFLNRIINQFPRDKKLMILMNEFGEVGVDGALVESEDLEMLEISKGSIFCACVKTDFIKGMYEIAQKIKPDVLLIESTGVANPTDLKRDLQLPIFNNRFLFKEQFCIVDAAHFMDEYGVFSSVENQIASSTRFIINKIDLATAEQIREVKRIIAQHHPEPHFYETTFAAADVIGLLALSGADKAEGTVSSAQMNDEELDQYIDALLDDPGASLSPPDILISAAFRWPGGTPAEICEMAAKLPRQVPRAKGFIVANGRTYLFNFVMGRFDLEEQNAPSKQIPGNVLVFIAPPDVMPAVEEILSAYRFSRITDG